MTLVKDIMTSRLIVVSPELTLRDLIDMLAAEHVGGAPVVAGGKPVGIITLDDVISFQASLPVVPTEGSEEIVWDEESEAGRETEEGTEESGVSFLESWSDAGGDVAERFAAVRGPEWDLLGEHTVAEAMSRRLVTVRPTDTVTQAARQMASAEIHRLLVVDDDRLCGVVTTSDITRALAEGRV